MPSHRSASPTSRCPRPLKKSGARSRPLPEGRRDMKDFAFHRPKTIADAVALLKARPGAKLLSGGQSLLPVLKLELAEPSDLVSLAALTDLSDIRVDNDRIVIGARCTHDTVTRSA